MMIYSERARQRVLRPLRGFVYRRYRVALFRTLDRHFAYPVRYGTTLHPLDRPGSVLRLASTSRSRATAVGGAMEYIDSLHVPFCHGRHQ